MANPTTAAEVSSSSTLDFSTADQSMWGSGPALNLDDSFTLFSASTGQLGFTALDGDLSVAASLGLALVANLSSSSGAISLDYPVDAGFIAPNLAAPGQKFTINTSANGLTTASPDFVPTFPHSGEASLDAVFTGGFNLDFDSFLTGSAGLSLDFNHDVPLVSVTSNQSVDFLDGHLVFTLPTDYDETQPVDVGAAALPSVSVAASTESVVAGQVGLLQTITELFFPEIKEFFPSGDFLDGAFEYTLAELTLSAGIGLAQQFTFDPTGVTADITAPWGEEEDVALGKSATFTVPDNWNQSVNLTTQYVLHGNLVSQFGIVGNLDLNLTILEGDLLGIGFGPLFDQDFHLASTDPLYLASIGGDNGFALQGFNTPTGSLAIALGTGLVNLPGGGTIDTTAFTANSTAVIQTVLDHAKGSTTQSNIFDPVASTGSVTAVAGKFNVEVVDPNGVFQLPAGFKAGFLEPGAGNAELDGTPSDVLLAAAPSAGHTDILKSNGHDTLVGGQDGGVKFVITSGFTGEIVGLTANDTIVVSNVQFSVHGKAVLGPNNVLTVTEGNHTFTIQLHATEDFTGSVFKLSADPNGGTDIGMVPPPPSPSGLGLAVASDSGAKGDGITNIAKPIVTGSGEVGDTVTLFDGSKVLGTAEVGAGGNWQIKTPTLADGTHNLSATEAESGGAVSDPSALFTVTIDTAPPPAPAGLALAAASDTGAVGDNRTSVSQPAITGSGEAGDTVTLLDGAKKLGTAKVDAKGNWSITSSLLTVGSHSLTASETDPAGNASGASKPLALTIGPPPIGPSGPDQAFFFGTNGQFALGTSGADNLWGNSSGSTIDGLAGNDILGAAGSNNAIDGGDGNDTVTGIGAHDTISGGKGADFLNATGDDNTLDGGAGPDQVWANGNGDTVSGGQGNDTIGLVGSGGFADGGAGSDTINVFGNSDTVTGNRAESIFLFGSNETLLDSAGVSNDTVVGFNAAAGDRIHLTTDTAANALAHSTSINSGLDTLITLADGSTITLKFVSHIDGSIFA